MPTLFAFGALLTTLLTPAIAPTANAKPTTANTLTGDYVEARTASVWAGPCHFNGELTTTGNDAEMAWHVRTGAWNGIALDGLNAVAAVSGEQNLRDAQTPRRTVLWIDARASDAQATALADALRSKAGASLGEIVAVKRAPVQFTRKGESFHVSAKNVTNLEVEAMPHHECCTMPNLVWYTPLFGLQNRRVGWTRQSGITDKMLGATWSKSGQNTAFYGTFAL